VTAGQFRQFDPEFKKSDPKSKPADDDAVIGVTWERAVAFCEWLSKKEGKPYRLPTEAEWEYACRGGTKTAFSFGNDEAELSKYAWWGGGIVGNGNAKDEQYAHRVAQKLPNPFGLHDMHGNVYEWCSDWYGDYPSTPLTDPRGPGSGSFRVLRGGSWNSVPYRVRCAGRSYGTPESRNSYFGFRLVLE
ncbi:MAG: formylglycine-generating enzyme family protein, partial [Planctomycetaceae bacterium]